MEKKVFDWTAFLFIVTYHVLLLVLVPIYLINKTPGTGIIIATVALFIITGLSVTAGYHRLYSHRSYKLNKFLEFFMIGAGSLAIVSSVLKWSHDHRLHHKYVDTDRDPYNIKEGFWHAHMLWIFYKKTKPWSTKNVKDLLKNPLVVFQHKHYAFLIVTSNVIVTLFLAYICNDFFGAVVFTFLLRLFVTHHCMYFINSLAHFWGSKPYSTEHTPVNNWLIAFVTFGEGYHNYHHSFAYDYRNGVKWYQFDPTKMLIWTLSKFGLASELKRAEQYQIYQSQVEIDFKRVVETLKKMSSQISIDKKTEILGELNIHYNNIEELIVKMKHLIHKHRTIERSLSNGRTIKTQIKELKTELEMEFERWGEFCSQYTTHHQYSMSQ